MSSIPSWPKEESAWIAAFDLHLRKKSFEQFKLLLCDFATSSEEQRQLLGKILFEDHNNASYWADYIHYAYQQFGDRKLHIQRLLNKALEILDEGSNKNNHAFLLIHLQSIKLKK